MIFNKPYAILSALIFAIEVIIAAFVSDAFVRPYVGDVLVVILIYCFVRTFFKLPVTSLTLMVLCFAFLVEFLQYIKIVELLGLEKSSIARTIIGTAFVWYDLVAYSVGAAIILFVEFYATKQRLTAGSGESRVAKSK